MKTAEEIMEEMERQDNNVSSDGSHWESEYFSKGEILTAIFKQFPDGNKELYFHRICLLKELGL